MRFLLSISISFLCVQWITAQVNDIYLTRYNEVYTVDKEVAEVDKEKYFLEGLWLPGMIDITGGKENLLQEIRYNLRLDQLETRINGKLYTVDPEYVESFYIEFGVNKYEFQRINLENFGLKKTNYVQVLANKGTFTLFKFYDFKKSKPNYNPVLQTGSRTSKISMIEAYGFSDGRKFTSLPKSAKKRKRILKRYIEFKETFKDRKLDLSKENDLITLFTIVNNKLKTNENIK